jgi:hypothetical protein
VLEDEAIMAMRYRRGVAARLIYINTPRAGAGMTCSRPGGRLSGARQHDERAA